LPSPKHSHTFFVSLSHTHTNIYIYTHIHAHTRTFISTDTRTGGREAEPAKAAPSKKEKYAYFDSIGDGICLQIKAVNISVIAREFDALIDVLDVALNSTDSKWQIVSDLHQSHLADTKTGIITLFK
jgi:hypothetical protein